MKSALSLLLILTCSVVNLLSTEVSNFKWATNVSSESVRPVLEIIALFLANPDYQNPKPDCEIVYPSPGNPCNCFYNGKVFRCLYRIGLWQCSYHKDCDPPTILINTTQVPSLGLSVPTWHNLSL